MKKRAVVICPGRGTYTKETLGYLRQLNEAGRALVARMDERRRLISEPTVSELDQAETFKPALHTKGEHASALIYTCAATDFMALDRDRHDIVAVTGNSMGWYLALALGGSLDEDGGFRVVNTMGSMMKDELVGGQVIYPVCDETWAPSPSKWNLVHEVAEKLRGEPGVEIYPSIYLGGFVIFGANKAGVAALLKTLPAFENYPFQLINHAAFHTPLMRETSRRGFAALPLALFRPPELPLIDGRGHIWQPCHTSVEDLHHYTLDHQVVEPYDFTRAIQVALKEFAPDHLILLGPGSTLGGALGQILIGNRWLGLKSKQDFIELQNTNPMVLAMGRAEQRALVMAKK